MRPAALLAFGLATVFGTTAAAQDKTQIERGMNASRKPPMKAYNHLSAGDLDAVVAYQVALEKK